jgi:hypothetical protein
LVVVVEGVVFMVILDGLIVDAAPAIHQQQLYD